MSKYNELLAEIAKLEVEAEAYFMELFGTLPHMKSGDSIVEMMEAHKELTKRVNELMTFANTVKFKDLAMDCVSELDARIEL